MKAAADTGGGSSTVTLDMLSEVQPENLRAAAASLTDGASGLRSSHEIFLSTVVQRIGGGDAWNGAGQPQAHRALTDDADVLTTLVARLNPAATVLEGFAGFLDSARKQVESLVKAASAMHLTIDPYGTVTVEDVPDESAEDEEKRGAIAEQLQLQAQNLLRSTTNADNLAAADLSALENGDDDSVPDPGDLEFWTQLATNPATAIGIVGALGDVSEKLLQRGNYLARLADAQRELMTKVTNPAMIDAARKAASDGYSDAVKAWSRSYGWKWLAKGVPESVPVLRGIPYVGLAATVFDVGWSVKEGESPAQAITSSGASTLAGAGAMAAVAAAGGPVTLVIAAGVVAGVGVGYLVDHYWDDISAAAEDVKDWTVDKYNDAKDWTTDTYHDAEDWATDTYHDAEDALEDAGETASDLIPGI